ncbi:flagellar hook-basal body complex protein FliE [Beijerinckia sp. L45]|uniref:flagellar hook-basal body complex protein FliE n=1 Tax=Beijerinckia sp. L45 TaxID=1641855 RepID=UPI00131EC90E|nr:flagellar hook-basal body complex protein FliE [Beijerinckia sp. L45]
MIAAIPLITSALSSVLGSGTAATAATQSVQSTTAAGGDFSSMLAQFSNDTVNKLNTSETMSVAGISGKATTQSVVEAVMSAQEALQTAVAVRDKAVSAFQEVTRMAI